MREGKWGKVKVEWAGYHLHGQVLKAKLDRVHGVPVYWILDKKGKGWYIPVERARVVDEAS